ncbi:hypothetical protein EH230_13900 [Flavobacterium columnare]|uniref:Uncharacterized protein n=1 Tax=Flavobacterium columnare TaxID=996 RepID=A0A437U8F3_9FLAO|nr:hypothetical protein [Flavobacterium columnare]RVU89851.1 hypothetical protein EH230_13900 [Flavobacterium columnare]
MKNVILINILILFINSIKGQTDTIKINNLKKNDTMEYFDINKYNDWKAKDSNSNNDKVFTKGDFYVRVMKYDSAFIEDIENDKNPIEIRYAYSLKTKRLIYSTKKIYNFSFEVTKEYDENGKLIKETDNDKNYPFKVEDLCKLIKEEYGVDLMVKPNPNKEELQYRVSRSYDSSILKHLYLVSFTYGNPDIEPGDTILPPIKVVYVDGSNGKILYEESRSLNLANGDKIPNSKTKFPQKGEKKASEVYKIYQGKSYTESEWEEFEEKQYEAYCKKTGRIYTPKEKATKTEDTIKKSSFIADDLEKGDKHAPKKKKGFWNNLFK